MKVIQSFYIAAMVGTVLLGADRTSSKTIHVPSLDGFGPSIERALIRESGVTITRSAGAADFTVAMEEKRKGYAGLLYTKNTGRRDARVLRLVAPTGKVMVEVAFDGYSQTVADRFARSVRPALTAPDDVAGAGQ